MARSKRRSVPQPPRPRKRSTGQIDVTRAEFNQVLAILRERSEFMANVQRDLQIQLQRIAQIQAELDEVKRAWQRVQVK